MLPDYSGKQYGKQIQGVQKAIACFWYGYIILAISSSTLGYSQNKLQVSMVPVKLADKSLPILSALFSPYFPKQKR